MIETRNKLVKLLHQHVDRPVIPNDTTARRPTYPYLDYSITSVNNGSGEGNYDFSNGVERVELQKEMAISINGYSKDEVEVYGLVKEAWDFFKFHVDKDDLVIFRQQEINNRTILEVDRYEWRYGFDVFIRFNDSIEKEVESIDLDDLKIIRR